LLLKALHSKLVSQSEVLSPASLSTCIFGMQSLMSETSEVNDIVAFLAENLEKNSRAGLYISGFNDIIINFCLSDLINCRDRMKGKRWR